MNGSGFTQRHKDTKKNKLFLSFVPLCLGVQKTFASSHSEIRI